MLSLTEAGEDSTVLLGDYREYEQSIDNSDESTDILRADMREIHLNQIGGIIGGVALPDMWREDN